MTAHISQSGFEDEEGFISVRCGCGVVLGPAPDEAKAFAMAKQERAGGRVYVVSVALVRAKP